MLGIIIVAYKNPERTAEYVANQLSRLKNPYVVVVVNNRSTMEGCAALAERCGGTACSPGEIVGKKRVYILHNAENLGFARGNNLGAEFLERNNPCEYLLFSNDDIILRENTDLQPMLDMLDGNAEIGAIGPDIVGIDGRHQSPHRRKISAYRQIGWMLFSAFRRKRMSGDDDNAPPVPEKGFCYWVSGAFFLMRCDVFKQIGGFDSDTFLYSEEPILAERLKSIGKRMYFNPDIRVKHLEGGSTKGSIGHVGIRKYIIESNCVYYRKYLNTPKIVVRLYKFLAGNDK